MTDPALLEAAREWLDANAYRFREDEHPLSKVHALAAWASALVVGERERYRKALEECVSVLIVFPENEQAVLTVEKARTALSPGKEPPDAPR